MSANSIYFPNIERRDKLSKSNYILFDNKANGLPLKISAKDIADSLFNIKNFESETSSIKNIQSLKAVKIEDRILGSYFNVLGYNKPNDLGGGIFYWDPNSTDTEDNGLIIRSNTSATGRWYRVIEDYVTPEMFGAVGDFNTNTLDGTDDVTAIETSLRTSLPVIFSKKYAVSKTIKTNTLNITGEGGEIHMLPEVNGGTKDYIISVGDATGSALDNLSPAITITSDVSYATNKIELADTSIFKVGDLVEVSSNLEYGGLDQGELATVMSVGVGYIELNGVLNDEYLVANTAIVRKVLEPIKCNIKGDFTLVAHPDTIDTAAPSYSGIRMYFTLNSNIEIKVRNCQRWATTFWNCFSPKSDVYIENTNISGSGYGVNINNSTTNGVFTGVVNGTRHAVSTGGAPGFKGISWNNRVSITGTSTSQSGTFDSHAPTGSIIFEDCVSIAGDYFIGNIQVTPKQSAFHVSAKKIEIKNCSVKGSHDSVVNLRYTFPNQIIEKLYIDGINSEEIDGHIVQLNQEGTINDFSMKNIDVKSLSGRLLSVSGNLNLPNILVDTISVEHFNGDRGFSINSSDCENLTIRNINIFSTGNLAGNVAFLRPSVSTNATVDMSDITIRNTGSTGMFLAGPLQSKNISFRGVRIYDEGGELSGVRFISGAGNTENLYITGCVFEGINDINFMTPSASATYNVDNLTIEDCAIKAKSGVVQTRITNVILSTVYKGIVKENTPFNIDIEVIDKPNYFEINNGSVSTPNSCKGYGSPEGVVEAPIGCKYTDIDGVAGACVYIKNSASGNTGWQSITT